MKITGKSLVTALAAFSIATFGLGTAAFAEDDDHEGHGHGDIELGSTALGGGQLMGEYNFDSVLRTDFSTAVGPLAVYGSTTPGIGAAEDEAPELYELNVGTTVEFALIKIDEGLSIQIGATTLDEIGEAASLGTYDGTPGEEGTLHAHPDYQIALNSGDSTLGGFGEGDIDFVFDDPDGAYQASEIYTFHVTNGYLAPVEDVTKAAAKCQKTVSRSAGRLISSDYKALANCLDAIQTWKAGGADPEEDLATAPNRVLKSCSDVEKGIVARTAANLAKATDKTAEKCVGTFGADLAASTAAIAPHMGMAACRVQELIGAAYSSGLEDIAVVVFADDEEAAEAAFPCIRESQGATIPEEEDDHDDDGSASGAFLDHVQF